MSTVTGNLASPIGHTRGLPVPTQPRPLTNRRHCGTSPFGDPNVPTPPDPDAIARLVRQGRLTITEEVREDKPVKVLKRTRPKAARKPRKPMGRKASTIDVEAAAALYATGANLSQVGAAFGITRNTVQRHLVAHGVTIRHPRTSVIDHDRIIQLAKDNMTQTEIARAMDIALPTVAKHLQSAGVKARRGQPGRANARDDVDWAVVRAQYEAGSTTPTLARDHGCSVRTVRDRLIGLGVVLRDDRAGGVVRRGRTDGE